MYNEVLRIAASVGATEMAAFSVGSGPIGPVLRNVLHVRPDDSDEVTRARAVAMFRDLALPCVRHAKNGAIEVDGPDAKGLRMFCLVALTRASDDDVVGALTFIVRRRELDEARLALGSVLRADSQH